jgi:hypothetical protein
MFKVYCHMSSQPRVIYTINPTTLLLIKKKRYTVRPRAREEQEYSFTLTLNYTLPLRSRAPTVTLFVFHPLTLELCSILL